MLVLMFLMALLNYSTVNAEKQTKKGQIDKKQTEQRKGDYWDQLLDVSETCFNTIDLKSNLINWKDKQQQKMKVIELISVGGEIILEIETAQMQLKVIEEEAGVLQQAMVQEGVQGIKSYFDVKKEIAKTKARLKVAQKQFEAILKVCGRR